MRACVCRLCLCMYLCLCMCLFVCCSCLWGLCLRSKVCANVHSFGLIKFILTSVFRQAFFYSKRQCLLIPLTTAGIYRATYALAVCYARRSMLIHCIDICALSMRRRRFNKHWLKKYIIIHVFSKNATSLSFGCAKFRSEFRLVIHRQLHLLFSLAS